MPRGRKTDSELAGMKKKMKVVSRFIAESEKVMAGLRSRLNNPNLKEKDRIEINKAIEKRNKAVIEKILSLDLNQDKIKRLTNKVKNLA